MLDNIRLAHPSVNKYITFLPMSNEGKTDTNSLTLCDKLSVGYDMKSVGLTEDAILTIFDELGDANPKRISSLMAKLNGKRVCMSDNRVIWRGGKLLDIQQFAHS